MIVKTDCETDGCFTVLMWALTGQSRPHYGHKAAQSSSPPTHQLLQTLTALQTLTYKAVPWSGLHETTTTSLNSARGPQHHQEEVQDKES